MDFLGARIQINPRPVQATQIALDVGVLGHCPGRVRRERLLALSGIVADMRAVGFGPRIDALLKNVEDPLYHLPIPLNSSAEFDDIFPDARTTATQYFSVLAGESAWLPLAVDDFFANGGERLWLVRVPEDEGVQGFFSPFATPLQDVSELRGIACLLAIGSIGLIALPDLERLQIPAQLPDIPRKRLANPDPTFIPLHTLLDDGHRERRHSSEIVAAQQPLPLLNVLRELLSFSERQRPDVQYLLSFPLGYSSSVAAPCADKAALAALQEARGSGDAYLLRQVQMLFPYLRANQGQLRSPVGVIAGAISASAKTRGVWRSIAGRLLVAEAQPYPSVDIQQTIALRDNPGLGILQHRIGQLTLDDERLLVPALHRNDYLSSAQYSARLDGTRSAEVVRFLGYLLRQLQALGERLIFNVDAQDPRPQLLLESFFRNLYRLGALRGKVAEEAYSIRRASAAENVIAFDIVIAPAYPIDKIVVTFINRDGEWASSINSSSLQQGGANV
ncbi:MAG TPA: hypothetical protein VN030_03315 [Cellvibrio sp.]|nr:hypothetical protein [Cellvibrio sp.]